VYGDNRESLSNNKCEHLTV